MSNIEEYTKNFKFMIPSFNVATWHTEIKENFKAIDALIANFVQAQQYKGAWKQVTSYVVNDLVYISDEDSTYYGSLMRIMVDHITTNDDFDTFITAHPSYYVIQGEMGAQIAALRAQDWAEKTDGMVIINEVPIDYSSKAYAIGGVGTETNNSKYFKEQAELARDTILQDPGFIAIKADFLGDETIKTVAENIAHIQTVDTNLQSIVDVSTNIEDVNTLASNIAAILTNTENISSINTNATNILDINNVSDNMNDINTCASNINAIINALTYAAQAKQWAIGDPSEPADGSAKYWAQRAHTYTEDVLHTDTISNCITEIPQDIKIEVSGTSVTLKSGSKYYFPDGTQVQMTSDVSSSVNADATYVLFREIGPYNFITNINNVVSGTTDPKAGQTYHTWFDTANNVINRYTTDPSTPQTTLSLPLCVIKRVNGIVTIEQVFNGAGYVGHHAFVLPSVKCLIPNGLNTDGTLKSISRTVDKLYIIESTSANNVSTLVIQNYTSRVGISSNGYEVRYDFPENPTNYLVYYLTKYNEAWIHQYAGWSRQTVTPFAKLTTVSSGGYLTITGIDILQPVRLATTKMTDSLRNQIDTKADKSLSNLNSTGQMVIDSQNGTISNCILDIPQDIKLELNNGTLTLKSGSVITKPDGTQLQMAADKTVSITTNNKYFIYPVSNGGFVTSSRIDKTNSGTTDSMVGVSYHVWYDTINNVINRYGSDGTTLEATVCLPVCIITVSNGAISSIDQVFNGFGYIGKNIFVLPGVKALGASGLNSDGTLKSTEISISSLITVSRNSPHNNLGIRISQNSLDITVNYSEGYTFPISPSAGDTFYKIDDNMICGWNGSAWVQYANRCYCLSFAKTQLGDSGIDNFNVRKATRLATTEMTDALDNNIQNFQNRFKVVASLPVTPEVGVFYFISEE